MGSIQLVESESYLRKWAKTHGFSVVKNARVGWSVKNKKTGRVSGSFIVRS